MNGFFKVESATFAGLVWLIPGIAGFVVGSRDIRQDNILAVLVIAAAFFIAGGLLGSAADRVQRRRRSRSMS